ncbi:MAG: vitamin K epoxide reductase family protein [Cellulomonadaceae bacterium]
MAHQDGSLPHGSAPDDPAPDGRLRSTALGAWLAGLGLVGFLASLALTIERYLTLADTDHVPSCSFNVFVTCGPAMESAAGSLLGFPNPIIGVAAFPVVVTIGVFLLILRDRLRLPRWFWLTFLLGCLLGIALVVFLIVTSLYELAALCPYCMVVWAVMIPIAWYALVYARQEGYLGGRGGVTWAVRNRVVVLVALYLAVALWVFAMLGPEIVDTFRMA